MGRVVGWSPADREAEVVVQEEWAKFPDLPGTHLSLLRVRRPMRWNLVTSEGSV